MVSLLAPLNGNGHLIPAGVKKLQKYKYKSFHYWEFLNFVTKALLCCISVFIRDSALQFPLAILPLLTLCFAALQSRPYQSIELNRLNTVSTLACLSYLFCRVWLRASKPESDDHHSDAAAAIVYTFISVIMAVEFWFICRLYFIIVLQNSSKKFARILTCCCCSQRQLREMISATK